MLAQGWSGEGAVFCAIPMPFETLALPPGLRIQFCSSFLHHTQPRKEVP
jgi:hypothetical protein